MSDMCTCTHELDEHRPHFGQCLSETPLDSRWMFCGCRGFERQVEGGNE